MIIHRLTATDTPMVRYTRTIFPSYAVYDLVYAKNDKKKIGIGIIVGVVIYIILKLWL